MKQIRLSIKKFNRNALLIWLFAFGCLLTFVVIKIVTQELRKSVLGQSNSSSANLGQIVWTEERVLQSYQGQLLWIEATSGDELLPGSSIQTFENSFTQLQLLDGQQIRLAPNSLVRFSDTSDGVELELVDGEMEVQPALSSALTKNSTDNSPDMEASLSVKKITSKVKLKTKSGLIPSKNEPLKIRVKKDSQEPAILETKQPNPQVSDAHGGSPQHQKSLKPSTLVAVTENGELAPKEFEKLPAQTVKVYTNEKSQATTPSTSALSPQVIQPIAPTESSPAITRATNGISSQNQKSSALGTAVPEPLKNTDRLPAAKKPSASKKMKNPPLPEKKPLAPPKIKRVDVKAVE